jgi:hypothetical protein
MTLILSSLRVLTHSSYREVFIVDTPQGHRANYRFPNDVSDDEHSVEAKTAHRQCNTNRANLHRELKEALPTRNLQEALYAVATRQYRTPKEAINAINLLGRSMPHDRVAAEVAKLVELAYTMLCQSTSAPSHRATVGVLITTLTLLIALDRKIATRTKAVMAVSIASRETLIMMLAQQSMLGVSSVRSTRISTMTHFLLSPLTFKLC